MGPQIGMRVLQCELCGLTGPYGYILTHMAINHNVHIGLKTCAYCDRSDLKAHITDGSLQQCYANYLQRNGLERNEEVCSIVTNFYYMLKGLSLKFKVITMRNCEFAGKRYKTVERFERGSDGGDIDENISVYTSRKPHITPNNISNRLDILDKKFKRVMYELNYNCRNVLRLLQQAAEGNDYTSISDVDAEHTTKPDQSVTSGKVGSTTPAASNITRRFKIRLKDMKNNPSLMSLVTPKSEPSPIVRIHRDAESSSTKASMPLSTTSTINASIDGRMHDAELFGQYVVQRLCRQADELKRRKLECAIQEAIVKTEKELFE